VVFELLNIVNEAERSLSDSTNSRRPIRLTFQPPISSPIPTRRVLSGGSERTKARAVSAPITTPNKTTSGGEGGGAGSARRTIGAGAAAGGAGGRRVGENQGRSRVANKLPIDCSATGLDSQANGSTAACVAASMPRTGVDPSDSSANVRIGRYLAYPPPTWTPLRLRKCDRRKDSVACCVSRMSQTDSVSAQGGLARHVPHRPNGREANASSQRLKIAATAMNSTPKALPHWGGQVRILNRKRGIHDHFARTSLK
jgi:hypothetical protein